MWPDAMIFIFWMLSFKPAFSLSSFTFIKRLFSSSLLSAIRVVSSAYLRLLLFLPTILILVCASSSVAFHRSLKHEGSLIKAKECSNYHTAVVISYTSKVMLKILQARFINTWTFNFQRLKLDLEKGEEPEIKLPTSTGSQRKQQCINVPFSPTPNICYILCFIQTSISHDVLCI